MPELTAEHADQLADQALNLKRAVGEFRNRFYDVLTPQQRDDLRSLTITLGDEVDHLTAVAIKMSVDDLRNSMDHLQVVTTGVSEAVAHLNEVRKVLTVATALVDLGSSIMSGDPMAVITALKGSVNSIQE